jgi:hypothetical protein
VLVDTVENIDVAVTECPASDDVTHPERAVVRLVHSLGRVLPVCLIGGRPHRRHGFVQPVLGRQRPALTVLEDLDARFSQLLNDVTRLGQATRLVTRSCVTMPTTDAREPDSVCVNKWGSFRNCRG